MSAEIAANGFSDSIGCSGVDWLSAGTLTVEGWVPSFVGVSVATGSWLVVRCLVRGSSSLRLQAVSCCCAFMSCWFWSSSVLVVKVLFSAVVPRSTSIGWFPLLLGVVIGSWAAGAFWAGVVVGSRAAGAFWASENGLA